MVHVGWNLPDVSALKWDVSDVGRGAPATDALLATYLEEAYVVSSMNEWLSTTGLSPSHYDFDGLQAAMSALL